METVSSSIFLQNLGHAILNNFWHTAFAYLFLCFLFCTLKIDSLIKYRLAQLAQSVVFILFIISCFYINAAVTYPVYSENILSTSWFNKINASVNSIIPYAAATYLVALAAQFILFFKTNFFTKSLAAKGIQKIPYPWRLYTDDIRKLLSIEKKIRIFLSDKITSPLTIGFLKPLILIPVACINQLNPAQMEAVILHELAHIKRADYLLHFINTLIEHILFFNPFTKLISKIIDEERENACDDLVMQFRYKPDEYASALLTIARMQTLQRLMALKISGNQNDVLLRRVKRILNVKHKNIYAVSGFRNFTFSIAVFLFIFIFSIMALKNKQEVVFFSKPNIEKVSAKVETFVLDKKNHKLSQRKFLPFEKNSKNDSVFKRNTQPVIKSYTDRVNYSDKEKPIKEKQIKYSKKLNIAALNSDEKNGYSYAYTTATDMPETFLQNTANNKIVLTPELYNQLLSYFNFKRMQYTIASVPADSIAIKENGQTQNSYRKVITIEATDSTGESKSFDITVELYQ